MSYMRFLILYFPRCFNQSSHYAQKLLKKLKTSKNGHETICFSKFFIGFKFKHFKEFCDTFEFSVRSLLFFGTKVTIIFDKNILCLVSTQSVQRA